MNSKADKCKKSISWIWLIGLIVFVLFTRFYKLGEVPARLHADEAGVAVNAYNIAKYGTDASGNPWPVYFLNYNGGQSAAYTYLLALSIQLFGLSAETIRLPGAVCGVWFVCVGTMVLQELLVGKRFSLHTAPFTKKQVGLVGASLIAIMPYFIQQCRFGLDCNLMMPAVTTALLVTIWAVKNEKIWLWIISGVCWGLALYTYALSYLMIPLFLLLLFVYLIRCHKFRIKNAVAMMVPILAISWPLILYVAVGTFNLDITRIGPFSLPKMFIWRGNEFTTSNIWKNILWMFYGLLGIEASGDNSIAGIGTFYWITVPLYLFGLEEIIRKEIRHRKEPQFRVETVLVLQNLSVWVVGLFLNGMDSIGRENGRLFSVFATMVYGGYRFAKLLFPHLKQKSSAVAAVISVCIILMGYFSLFWVQYQKQYASKNLMYYIGFCEPELQQVVDLDSGVPIYWDIYTLRDWKYFELCFELPATEFNEQGFVKQTEGGQEQEHLKYDPRRWTWKNVRFGITDDIGLSQPATFVVLPQHTDLIQKLDANTNLRRVYDKNYIVYKSANDK